MLGFQRANTLSHRLQILATIFSDLDPKTKTLDFKQTITYHYLLKEKRKKKMVYLCIRIVHISRAQIFLIIPFIYVSKSFFFFFLFIIQ